MQNFGGKQEALWSQWKWWIKRGGGEYSKDRIHPPPYPPGGRLPFQTRVKSDNRSNSGQAQSAYNVKIAIMFLKSTFLWHTRSADHNIDWLICDDMRQKIRISCMLIPFLGCIKSHHGSWLHLTATSLTDMFYLLTDVAVCEIEEIP